VDTAAGRPPKKPFLTKAILTHLCPPSETTSGATHCGSPATVIAQDVYSSNEFFVILIYMKFINCLTQFWWGGSFLFNPNPPYPILVPQSSFVHTS
jgi:hypothetical protein